MPPKKKSPKRQHKTIRSKSKSPPRTAVVGDKRRRSPSPKYAPAAAMAPFPTPLTGAAARAFGRLLPSMVDLPSSPIETTNIAMGFKSTTNSLADDVVVAAYNEIDFIVANIEVQDVPERAHHGCPFEFNLVINDAYARTHPEAVELLQNHAHVNAHIKETRTKLAFACTPLEEDGLVGVTVCISIPPGIGFQYVIVSGIRVAGKPILPFNFPLLRQIVPGMVAPLEMYFNRFETRDVADFAIALNSVMYVLFDNAMPVVRVFAADGTEQPLLTVPTALELRNLVFVDTLNMLLFATGNTLIAFNVEGQTIRWQKTITTGGAIYCKPSVLSTRDGVCMITTTKGNEVHVYSLDDGTLRDKARLPDWCASHTCDSATSTWYASMSKAIVSFRWDGTELVGARTTPIPHYVEQITVMPPTAGRHTSHLLSTRCTWAGIAFKNVHLCVYALPDLRLVCSLSLLDWSIELKTDPSGTSIARLDRRRNLIRVLPWPLAGMPALE